MKDLFVRLTGQGYIFITILALISISLSHFSTETDDLVKGPDTITAHSCCLDQGKEGKANHDNSENCNFSHCLQNSASETSSVSLNNASPGIYSNWEPGIDIIASTPRLIDHPPKS